MTDKVFKAALVSKDQRHRYWLTRSFGKPWDDKGNNLLFVMLNPSTADADVDDPTVMKCCKYASFWGFDGVAICNLFSFRATDPGQLYKRPPAELHNQETDDWLRVFEAASKQVVCAWGTHGLKFPDRVKDVLNLLSPPEARRDLYALKLSKAGAPGHPLYLKDNAKPFVWKRGAPPPASDWSSFEEADTQIVVPAGVLTKEAIEAAALKVSAQSGRAADPIEMLGPSNRAMLKQLLKADGFGKDEAVIIDTGGALSRESLDKALALYRAKEKEPPSDRVWVVSPEELRRIFRMEKMGDEDEE